MITIVPEVGQSGSVLTLTYSYPGETEAEKKWRRRARASRIRQLQREIQMAKQRLREYDHLLAELRQLQKWAVDELKEEARLLGKR